MKDETKEILDDLRSRDAYVNNETILTFDEASQLLDYITNLQEGNHNLLQEIEDMQNKNNKLIEENERLKKDYGLLMQDNAYILELERRNEKAVEYIVNNCDFQEIIISDGYNDKIIKIKDLVNILEGDKDE